MANFKRIPILVDAATGKQIDEFGAVVRDNDFFRLLFDETVILCCQFYDVTWIEGEAELSEHSIDEDLTLEAFGDNDFDPQTSFMFLSEQTGDADNKVNIANDWFDGSTAEPANGQLSFRVDTNTVRFAEALNSTSLQKFYFCITGVPGGETAKSVLAYFSFKAENRPSSSAGEPVSSDPEYLTAQEVQALVKTAPLFEFSIDGLTLWHSIQVTADQYYREQRNGGEWSDAIQMLPGASGPTGTTGPAGTDGTNGTDGTDGATGPAGADGADGIDGTGYNDRGDYSSLTTYTTNDTVTYDGSLFFSLSNNNIDNVPNSSPAHWRLLVSQGADGTNGTDGTNGVNGTDGNTWFFSTGIPSAGLGADGDSALDTVNMKIYLKVSGSWVLQGAIKGDTGADGTGITPQGEWNSAADYVLNDAVSSEGSLWRAIQASTDETPPSLPTTSNDYWDIIVAKGNTGTDGNDGTNGNDLSIEYSINGSTLWHATYVTGDIYIRFSTDGEATWSPKIPFITSGMDEAPADDDHYLRVACDWISIEKSGLLNSTGISEAQAIEIALIYS